MKKERVSTILLLVCAMLGALIAVLPLIGLIQNPYAGLAGIIFLMGNIILLPVGWIFAVFLYTVLVRIVRIPTVGFKKAVLVCAILSLCGSFPVVFGVWSFVSGIKTSYEISNFHVKITDIRESLVVPDNSNPGSDTVQIVYEVRASVENTGSNSPLTGVYFYLNDMPLTRVETLNSARIPSGTTEYIGRLMLRPSMLEELIKSEHANLTYSFDRPYLTKGIKKSGIPEWPAPDPAIVARENARIQWARTPDFDDMVKRGVYTKLKASFSLDPHGQLPNNTAAVTSEVNGKAVSLPIGDSFNQLFGIRDNHPDEYITVFYALLGPLDTLSTAKITREIAYDLDGIRIVNERGVPMRLNSKNSSDFVDFSHLYGLLPQQGVLKRTYDFDQWGLAFFVPVTDFDNPQKTQRYYLTYREGSSISTPITITITRL